MARTSDITDRAELEDQTEFVIEEQIDAGSGWVIPLVHTSVDAMLVTRHGGHRVMISIDDTKIETPPVEHLAFYVGLGTLVGLGLVELPIAAALGVGHILIDFTRRPGMQALGEALEEA